MLATSALGFSVARPHASSLAERELEASICVILASVLSLEASVIDDNAACALASGYCDPFLAIWPPVLELETLFVQRSQNANGSAL